MWTKQQQWEEDEEWRVRTETKMKRNIHSKFTNEEAVNGAVAMMRDGTWTKAIAMAFVGWKTTNQGEIL